MQMDIHAFITVIYGDLQHLLENMTESMDAVMDIGVCLWAGCAVMLFNNMNILMIWKY